MSFFDDQLEPGEVSDGKDSMLQALEEILTVFDKKPNFKEKYQGEVYDISKSLEYLQAQVLGGNIDDDKKVASVEETYNEIEFRLQAIRGKFFFDEYKADCDIYQEIQRAADDCPISRDPDALIEAFAQFVSDEAMISLQAGTDKQKQQALIELRKKQYELRKSAFFGALSDFGWSKQTWQAYERLLLSPLIDEVTALHLVGAIVLAGTTFFDYYKFRCLFDVYEQAESEMLRQHALVGFLLFTAYINNDTAFRLIQKTFSDKLKAQEREGSKQFAKDILEVQKLLTLNVASKSLSEDFSTKMNHAMNKSIFRSLKQMIENQENGFSLDDIDSEEELEQQIDNDYMDEESANMLDNMTDLGVDSSIAQFRQLSKAKFFEELSNWFLPFDQTHPLVFEMENALGSHLPRFFYDKALGMCSLDTYGLLASGLEDIEGCKGFLNSLPKDDKLVEENDDLVENGSSESYDEYDIMQMRRSFIRDLFRFYHYSDFANGFYNVFEAILAERNRSYQVYSFLSAPLYDLPCFKKMRLNAARYASRLENHEQVLWLLDKSHLDTAESNYMLSLAFLTKGKAYEAYLYALRAEALKPTSLRVKRLLCSCYEKLGLTDAFLDNAFKIIRDSKDPEEVLDYQIQCVKGYLRQRDVESAIELCYEVEYKHPDSLMAKALLCLCLIRRLYDGDIDEGDDDDDKTAETLDKVESIIESSDKISMLSAEDKAGSKFSSMADLFDMIGSIMEQDPIATALFSYCRGLMSLIMGKSKLAQEYFESAYTLWSNNGKKQLFVDLLLDFDSEWLVDKYAYSIQELKMIHSAVCINQHSMMEKIKNYANKQQ